MPQPGFQPFHLSVQVVAHHFDRANVLKWQNLRSKTAKAKLCELPARMQPGAELS